MKKEPGRFREFLSFQMRTPVWVVLILLAAVFIFFTTVGAQIEGQRANAPAFPAVRDCPDGIEGRPPSRIVLQHIDGVFHKWEEYDLAEGGAFCIFLRKPEERRLSIGESRTLLENSTRWREQAPAAGVREVLDPDDPRLLAPPAAPKLPADFRIRNAPASSAPDRDASPAYPFREDRSSVSPERITLPKPEDVIEADTRVRVTNTEGYPYNTIGYILNAYASGSEYRGTGFIASPYVVLTTGHLIYDKDDGGYVTKIDFSPGQRQMFAGGGVDRPYGTLAASHWETDPRYIDALNNDPDAQFDYDYAAVFFDTAFSGAGISTYMPLVFHIQADAGTVINLAGYPGAAQDEKNSRAMWHSSGIVLDNRDRIVYYDADTSGGNSGSPVWKYFSASTLWRVIAVHAFGTPSFNGGPRLVTQNQAIIEGWVAWTPPVPSSGGVGCFIATAAYGSYLDPHVQVLRNFRDRYLLGYQVGQELVQFYYRTSPPLAGMIAASEASRLVARWFLTPVVGVAYLAVRFGITTMLLVPSIGFLLPVAIIRLSGRGCRHDRRRSAAVNRLSALMK